MSSGKVPDASLSHLTSKGSRVFGNGGISTKPDPMPGRINDSSHGADPGTYARSPETFRRGKTL